MLSCSSLNVKIDTRIAAQLLYHTVRAAQSVDAQEWKDFCQNPDVVRLANTFHRAGECGKIACTGEGEGKVESAAPSGVWR